MTREEAIEFLTFISRTLGNMSIEYLTEKDGEKMREAIKVLEQEPKAEKVIKMRDATSEEQKSVYDYIKSISRPTGVDFWDLEQEPCEDAISRQAVLKIIDGWYENNRDTENIEDLIILITYMASVKQEPKTGHWIRWYEQKETERYIENIPHCKCSECGKKYDPHSSQFIKFCSNCGARMVEPQESEG